MNNNKRDDDKDKKLERTIRDAESMIELGKRCIDAYSKNNRPENKSSGIRFYTRAEGKYLEASKLAKDLGCVNLVKKYENESRRILEEIEKLGKPKRRPMGKYILVNRKDILRHTTTGGSKTYLIKNHLFLPIASITAFALTLAFSSFNITGFIISDTMNSIENYISLGFFLLGIFFASLYLGKVMLKKNKKEIKKN